MHRSNTHSVRMHMSTGVAAFGLFRASPNCDTEAVKYSNGLSNHAAYPSNHAPQPANHAPQPANHAPQPTNHALLPANHASYQPSQGTYQNEPKMIVGEELYTLNGGQLEKSNKLPGRSRIDTTSEKRPGSRRGKSRYNQSRGSYTERDLSDTPPSSSTSQSRVTSTTGCTTTTTLSSQFGQSPVGSQTEAFRPLASRSNFLSGQQIAVRFPQTNYPSATTRGVSDDLIATGTSTNWKPSSNHSTCRKPPLNQSSICIPQNSSKKLKQNATTSARKENDPRYTDPFIGAASIFQQRIAELASMEADTIRKERLVKVKKKYKTERDS